MVRVRRKKKEEEQPKSEIPQTTTDNKEDKIKELSLDDLNNAKIEYKPPQLKKDADLKTDSSVKIDLFNVPDQSAPMEDQGAKLRMLKATAAKTALMFEKAIYKYTTDMQMDPEEEAMLHETWKGLCNEFITDANSGKMMAIAMFAISHGGFWFTHIDDIKENMRKKKLEKAKNAKPAQQETVQETVPLKAVEKSAPIPPKVVENGRKSAPLPPGG